MLPAEPITSRVIGRHGTNQHQPWPSRYVRLPRYNVTWQLNRAGITSCIQTVLYNRRPERIRSTSDLATLHASLALGAYCGC